MWYLYVATAEMYLQEPIHRHASKSWYFTSIIHADASFPGSLLSQETKGAIRNCVIAELQIATSIVQRLAAENHVQFHAPQSQF